MPTYILLSTLTPEGRQTLHRNPERLEEVNREITEFGARSSHSMLCWVPMILSALLKRTIMKPSRICPWISDRGGPCTLRPCRPCRWPSCRRN